MLQVKVPLPGQNGKYEKKVVTLDPDDFFATFKDFPSEIPDIAQYTFGIDCPGEWKWGRRVGGGHPIEIKGLNFFFGKGERKYHIRCKKHKADITCTTRTDKIGEDYTLHLHPSVPDKIMSNKRLMVNVYPAGTSMPAPETS